MKIGILTSGGDAPGMNSCIANIVENGENIEVFGFYDGFQGLVQDNKFLIKKEHIQGISSHAGTILRSSRFFVDAESENTIISNLKRDEIEYLIILGGDGSKKLADKLSKRIKVIFIPATIDNDLELECIGFDSAINSAMQAIDKIAKSAQSHNRNFLIEVMGNQSKKIAESLSLTELNYILYTNGEETAKKMKFSSNIIIFPECLGDIEKARIELAQHSKAEIRTATLGHIQRGADPTARDRILGAKYGKQAIELIGKENDKKNYK